ncbi:MAG TPA: thiamine pyrophosphate-binding protein [Deltaproteobacteria bacterium]|nr:thiamine pyrophosphate-binding protein [Deltaproteobacteria bacterium]
MNGGARVAEVLKAHGVPFLFTLVGGHISPILVSAKARGIRVIDVRHEVNAVFAADAVGRLTGIPGVAAVTAGPGVTNAITAIKNAQLAQSPLLLLGGATATILRGRGSLQDIDQVALMRPHVKFLARPNRLRDVIPALEEAMYEARSGVPGPVFVELAVDLLYDQATVREWYGAKLDKPDPTLSERAQAAYVRGHLRWTFQRSKEPHVRSPRAIEPVRVGRRDLDKAATLLRDAGRPLMVLGSQVMLHPGRVDELVRAVESIGAPVYLSGMARGLLGPDHPLQKRHKRRKALKSADVVVLAGVPSDFRLDYGSHVSRSKVIGINLSSTDLNKNRRPDLGLLVDPHTALVQLSRVLPPAPDRAGWMEVLDARDAERDAEIDEMAAEPCEPLNPLAFCRALDHKLVDDSLLVGDGGDFIATAAYTLSPRGPLSWLDPGVFGTLGVGAGFAMGAKLVRPDADVWLLWGDGAAGFSLMELDTFARHGLPVISVIGNDAGWTQILRDQEPILGDDVACRLTHMDYHVVADGCGAKGLKLDRPEDVDRILDEAVSTSRSGTPVLVNALLGRSDFRKGSISM